MDHVKEMELAKQSMLSPIQDSLSVLIMIPGLSDPEQEDLSHLLNVLVTAIGNDDDGILSTIISENSLMKKDDKRQLLTAQKILLEDTSKLAGTALKNLENNRSGPAEKLSHQINSKLQEILTNSGLIIE